MFINSAISRRNALTGSIMLIAALGLMFTLPFQVEAASPCPAVNDWCTTMTVADAEGDGLLHGYEFDKFGSIVDDTIQPGGENINVWTVHTFAHPLPQLTDYIYFGSIPRVPRGTQVTIEGRINFSRVFHASIPTHLITAATGGAAKTRRASAVYDRWTTPQQQGRPERPQASPYKDGERVRHATFGEGVVVSSTSSGADYEVTVAFKGDAGIKRLLLSYAPLEKA